LQRLLGRLSIFVGGCRVDEAEAVCAADELGLDLFDGLANLVDQSLLRQVESSGEPRFSMLQTIRDFAMEQLIASPGEAETTARRHAAAYLALAQAAEPHMLSTEQRRWLDLLERDHDNFRAAIAWAVDHDEADVAVGLALALWRFWQFRGHLREATARVDALLTLPAVQPPTLLRRKALDAAAGLAYWTADLDRSRELYNESLAIARASGDPRAIGEALYNLSFTYSIVKSDVAKARVQCEEALAIFRSLHDDLWIARSLWALVQSFYFADDYEAARGPLTECVALFRSVGDTFGLGWALHTTGLVELRTGNPEGARRHWTEMIEIFHKSDDTSAIGTALSNFRELAVVDGDGIRAIRLAGAGSGIVQRTGSDLTSVIEEIEGRLELDTASVDRATAAAAWAEGRAMSVDEAVAYALERGASGPQSAQDVANLHLREAS
jgi:tetratricopeptide (TPR) repeat protein